MKIDAHPRNITGNFGVQRSVKYIHERDKEGGLHSTDGVDDLPRCVGRHRGRVREREALLMEQFSAASSLKRDS